MSLLVALLLAAGCTVAAISNSKQANANYEAAKTKLASASAVVDPSLKRLDFVSGNLRQTLKETERLKENALSGVTDAFVYYLKHINDKVTKKLSFEEEIGQLNRLPAEYSNYVNGLLSKNLDANAMLVSAATGVLVTGAGLAGLSALGVSASLGLGLSFFGVGSVLMSAVQLEKSRNVLEEADFLDSNKYSLRDEIDHKTEVLYQINNLFDEYNRMLSELFHQGLNELRKVQATYRRAITDSKENVKLISRGEEPVIPFDTLSKDERQIIYAALGKMKVLAEFARAKVLNGDGSVNETECRRIDFTHE